MNETLDNMYLVVKQHFDAGKYLEDYWDFGDTYIGVFDCECLAQAFLKVLPMVGEEYTEEDSKYPERERNFRNQKSENVTEYIRYKIIPVIKF